MDFKGRRFWWLIPGGLPLTFVLLLGIWWQSLHPAWAQSSNLNATSPATPVRLVFIHHSVGEGWLTDDFGNLLRDSTTTTISYLTLIMVGVPATRTRRAALSATIRISGTGLIGFSVPNPAPSCRFFTPILF